MKPFETHPEMGYHWGDPKPPEPTRWERLKDSWSYRMARMRWRIRQVVCFFIDHDDEPLGLKADGFRLQRCRRCKRLE